MAGFAEWFTGRVPDGLILSWLMDSLLQAAVLLPLIAAVMWFSRKSSAALRHQMWMLVLIALLIAPPLAQWVTFPIDAEAEASGDTKSSVVNSTVSEPQPDVLAAAKSAESAEPPQAKLAAPGQQTVAGVQQREVAPGPQQVLNPSLAQASQASPQAEADRRRVDTPPGTSNATTSGGVAVTPDSRVSEWRWVPTRRVARTVSVVWLAGVLLLVLRLSAAQLILWRTVRAAQPWDNDRLQQLADSVAREISLDRSFQLQQAHGDLVPMTCGVWRPVVVLPAAARQWDSHRLRMVLIHELAHIKRRDCCWQWLMFVATTMQWFNPLVWLVTARMRIEREQACDDAVLNHGVRGSDYAEVLLDISTGCRRNVFAMCAGVAMARSARLSARVQAILDQRRDRRSVSRLTAVAASLGVVAMLPLLSLFAHAGLQISATNSLDTRAPNSASSTATGPRSDTTVRTQQSVGQVAAKGAQSAAPSQALSQVPESPSKPSQAKQARASTGAVFISIPPGQMLPHGERQVEIVDRALELLDSARVEVPYQGQFDTSLLVMFSPAREIDAPAKPKTGAAADRVRIGRMYIDVQHALGPRDIVAEIDGKYRSFAQYEFDKWVAFRSAYSRLTWNRPRPIVPAVGAWSEPVNGLQARLAVDNWRDPMIGVFLELKNVSDLVNTVTIPVDAEKIDFKLLDSTETAVASAEPPRSGPVVELKDFQLPFDSSLRFNLSVSTVGVDVNAQAMIPLRAHAWLIREGDFNPYQLSASFEVVRDPKRNGTFWHGALSVPPVRIQPAQPKPVADQTITRPYVVRAPQQAALVAVLKRYFAAAGSEVLVTAGQKPHQIEVTAKVSQQDFISEFIAAYQRGHRPQSPEAVRIWLRNYAFRQAEFSFVRIKYPQRSIGRIRQTMWATDYPDADLGFSQRLADWTSMKVDPQGKVLELTDKRLPEFPFVYVAEPSHMILGDSEVQALREYLVGGGFLMLDDFWGVAEWEHVKAEMKKVFPKLEPVDLPLEHPLFHNVFELREKPQVCSIHAAMMGRAKGTTWERPDGRDVHYWGLSDPESGRLMAVLCHNTDLGDGWERRDDLPWYTAEFSEQRAFPMGLNIVFQALTQ